MKALRDSALIAPEWFENQQKCFFQRASRTDKGVSAARMIVSLKMSEYGNGTALLSNALTLNETLRFSFRDGSGIPLSKIVKRRAVFLSDDDDIES